MRNENKPGRGEKVALVALGCPKNLVDLQVAAAALSAAGFDVGVPEEEADAILVNTCAFIESARREALDAIEEACSRPLMSLSASHWPITSFVMPTTVGVMMRSA